MRDDKKCLRKRLQVRRMRIKNEGRGCVRDEKIYPTVRVCSEECGMKEFRRGE
jgi:hypothetical protein